MSRIGKIPVPIPDKVKITIKDDQITVKGPKGNLTKKNNSECMVKIVENEVLVKRASDSKSDKAFQGMLRSIIDSMITGVVDGFEKKLGMKGVGYNAKLQGKKLVLEVGFSHPVEIEAEEDIEFAVEKGEGDINTVIIVKGIDKQKVGEVAARIREIRKPEPYKAKGIRYIGEHIRRKVGKTG